MSSLRITSGTLVALALAVVLELLAPARAAADRFYTVRSGDTVAGIARRFRVSPRDLVAANRLGSRARIRPGQTLRVPPRGVVYVRPGQTLSHIARAHHCSIRALAHANRMRTTQTLRAGQRLYLPGFQRSRRRDWGDPDLPGVVTLRRRDVQVRFRLLDDAGRVSRRGLTQLTQLMQRHVDDPAEAEAGQTDEPLAEDEDAADLRAAAEAVQAEQGGGPEEEAPPETSPPARLAALLAKISDHFGGRRIILVSGFREARGYTRETSQHVVGHATDIRVQGVPNRVLWDYCRSLANTGCGYYPNSTFVHVDVRGRHAQWVDWSRPGRRPRYGSLSGPGRRRMRRDPVRRRITRPEEVPLAIEIVDLLEEDLDGDATHAGEPHPGDGVSDEEGDVAASERDDASSADG